MNMNCFLISRINKNLFTVFTILSMSGSYAIVKNSKTKSVMRVDKSDLQLIIETETV